MQANDKKLITQSDLAERLQVSEWMIWAMRKRGELPPAVRVGRMLRWQTSTIDKWLEDSEMSASEFDPVLSKRAEICVRSRNLKKKTGKKQTRAGRPTKKEQVEGRS